MTVLKRSQAQETGEPVRMLRRKAAGDRRQRNPFPSNRTATAFFVAPQHASAGSS
jgi:hypothetical protein